MAVTNLMSYLTKENLLNLLEKYRSFEPFPDIFLTADYIICSNSDRV